MLERSAICPFALDGQAGGIAFFSMAGQPEYQTIGEDPFFLTQGFEQPRDKQPIQFDLLTEYNTCTGEYSVMIQNLSGCTDAQGAAITWNGVPGDTLFFTPEQEAVLQVTGPVGCYAEMVLDLSGATVVSPDCAIVFYSYISPNGDGVNDEWIIEHIQSPRYRKNSVRILNRWAQEVWGAENYDNTSVVWRGDDSGGGRLTDGTYFYVVDIDGQMHTGYIELQR